MNTAPTRRWFGALLGATPLLWTPLARSELAGQVTHTVTIRGFAFQPADLMIAVGDRVTWINTDIAPHTATELEEHLWDTGELGQNDTGSVTFHQPGPNPYFCVFHPNMRGVVRVVE